MTRRFAADTSVSMDRSIAEIRTTVRRYGANEFIGMTEAEHANRMAWLDGEIASLDTPTPTPGGLAEGER